MWASSGRCHFPRCCPLAGTQSRVHASALRALHSGCVPRRQGNGLVNTRPSATRTFQVQVFHEGPRVERP